MYGTHPALAPARPWHQLVSVCSNITGRVALFDTGRVALSLIKDVTYVSSRCVAHTVHTTPFHPSWLLRQ
jgi:hypothetical protein